MTSLRRGIEARRGEAWASASGPPPHLTTQAVTLRQNCEKGSFWVEPVADTRHRHEGFGVGRSWVGLGNPR